MLQERIEPAWLAAFEAVFLRCALQPGDCVAVLCESQSRPVLVELALLAAARLGGRVFRLELPSVWAAGQQPPSRSTGASAVIGQLAPVVQALAASHLVVDCTVEGLMHAPELPAILAGLGGQSPKVIYISNEHPEALARLLPTEALEQRVKAHVRRLRAAQCMRVTSAAGTDLVVQLKPASETSAGLPGPTGQAVVGGNWGSTTRGGTLTHWPGGLALAFPPAGSVNGTLVLAPGDVNLTFKRYIERPIRLTLAHDHIVAIEGQGVDAELMRSHLAAWAGDDSTDRNAYAVSHVGYGLNPAARWDSMALYDKRDFNGTELRAFAGNFLYSTGANEVAGRHTAGHFDLPMRHCTVALDGVVVVDCGRVVDGV
jgi:2,5-dihydroxypyridine 5,6-dioxygenase